MYSTVLYLARENLAESDPVIKYNLCPYKVKLLGNSPPTFRERVENCANLYKTVPMHQHVPLYRL